MKGQSSMEFLAYVSLSMLMLAVLYTVMADRQADTFQQQVQSNARGVADKVSFNLEMALVQGEGYSRVISLPEAIAGQEYSFLVTDGLIRVNWSSGRVVESTRYSGQDISFDVDSSNVFRVKNNESGVFMVEQ